jgi:hypothetical protein
MNLLTSAMSCLSSFSPVFPGQAPRTSPDSSFKIKAQTLEKVLK